MAWPNMSLLLLFMFQFLFLFNDAASNHGHRYGHSPNHRHRSNSRLRQAYIALQAWKRVIYSDPRNFTTNWVGPNVCNYHGVFCANPPDNPKTKTVAGIDLNSGDIAGFLPEELGLLTDLTLLHLNSNRFCGILPQSIANLSLLFELDLSNNRFVGGFPSAVLSLPELKFLDLRFNEFEGPTPPELFEKPLDAIFINNNRLTSAIPSFNGRSSASVVVIANNKLGGCLPPSIANFADGLEELLLINTSIKGCLPPEIGYLYKLRLLDLSNNEIAGPIPYSLAGLAHLETLNLADNKMRGIVPGGVCVLPDLASFNFSGNFFCEEDLICANLTAKRGAVVDDRRNCLPEKRNQRSKEECERVVEHPVDCYEDKCFDGEFPISVAPAASPVLPPSMGPSST